MAEYKVSRVLRDLEQIYIEVAMKKNWSSVKVFAFTPR